MPFDRVHHLRAEEPECEVRVAVGGAGAECRPREKDQQRHDTRREVAPEGSWIRDEKRAHNRDRPRAALNGINGIVSPNQQTLHVVGEVGGRGILSQCRQVRGDLPIEQSQFLQAVAIEILQTATI